MSTAHNETIKRPYLWAAVVVFIFLLKMTALVFGPLRFVTPSYNTLYLAYLSFTLGFLVSLGLLLKIRIQRRMRHRVLLFLSIPMVAVLWFSIAKYCLVRDLVMFTIDGDQRVIQQEAVSINTNLKDCKVVYTSGKVYLYAREDAVDSVINRLELKGLELHRMP